jgi:hypothetical protein
MMKRARGLLAVLLLALGACGGGDEDADDETTTTEAAAAADDSADGSTDGEDATAAADGPCAALDDLEDPFAFGEVIDAASDIYKAEVGLTSQQAQGGSFANAGCTDEGLRLQHQAPDGSQSLLVFEWDGDTPVYVEELEPAVACELPDINLSLQEVFGCG